jgi:DNA-binding transcriptional LysR family regulator
VIELRQLRAFVAVADAGTFVAAAQRLGVVQPAVSQAVRRLEDELGLVLFDRSSRRVTLTSPGAAFLPEARAVLARLAEAEQVGRDLGVGRSGLVRLATTPGAPGLVAALLAHQRATHPDVHVEIVSIPQAAKLRAVLDGEIDLALTHSAPVTPGVAFTEVWREPWLPVVSVAHPLAAQACVALEALAGHPLVTVGDATSGTGEQFVALCEQAGFHPTLGPTYATLGDALVEIARTTGWTLLRASNARNVGDLGLVALTVAGDGVMATLWLAHRSDPPPATRALLALAARLHASGELLPPLHTAGGPEA